MRAKTSAILLALILTLSFCLNSQSAPAPDENADAKAKLQALKKKLPELLKKELADKTRWRGDYEAKVKSLRQISPHEAKLSIGLLYSFPTTGGEIVTAEEEIVFIFLKYHDGAWTTCRFEASFVADYARKRGVMLLMEAIDELGEKHGEK